MAGTFASEAARDYADYVKDNNEAPPWGGYSLHVGFDTPRNDAEMKKAPKQARIPLVYVISRGNRDGRPLPTAAQLADMGYKAAIDALTYLLASFHFAGLAYREIRRTGGYTGLSREQCVAARQAIEDLVGLDEFYAIEEQTVEKKKWGRR